MIPVSRLQTYLRHSAATGREVVHVPPFTLTFNSSDALTFFNCALPDAPVSGDLSVPLAQLRTEFLNRQRRPRFEFIEGFAPELALALRAAGFEEESRLHMMLCTPESFKPPSEVAGLTLTLLDVNSPVIDLQEFKMVQQQGFSHEIGAVEPVTTAEAEIFRQQINIGGHVLARLDGQAVGAGSFTIPLDGLTEVAGIATLAEFRRRGIAAAVTARLTQQAFARGVEAALLTAGDERAGRVYERVGFYPYATSLAYVFKD